jgi:ribosomal protein L12E/L44/L45/RPP1/RPP2
VGGYSFRGVKTWGDVFELGDQELVSELADVTSLENTLAAQRLTLLAEIDRRGLAMKLGHSSVTRWYAKSVRITDGSAARQNALGYWLFDHPTVLDALADGHIHAAHAAAIAEGYDVVLVADPTLDHDRREGIVDELLDTAMRNTAGQVTSRAQALAHAAADDARARHAKAEKQRREQEQREQERRAADTATSSDRHGEPTLDPEPPAPEPVPPTPAPRPNPCRPNPLQCYPFACCHRGRASPAGQRSGAPTPATRPPTHECCRGGVGRGSDRVHRPGASTGYVDRARHRGRAAVPSTATER